MNPTQALLQTLKPVHSPEAIGPWPPAIGWWLVVFTTVLCLFLGLRFLIKRYQANAWRRIALKELAQIQADYRAQPCAQTHAQILALLLRAKRSMAAEQATESCHAPSQDLMQACANWSKQPISDIQNLFEGHYRPCYKPLPESLLQALPALFKGLRP